MPFNTEGSQCTSPQWEERTRVTAAAGVNTSAVVAHDFTVNFLAEPRRLLVPASPKHYPTATVTLTDVRSGGTITHPAGWLKRVQMTPPLVSNSRWNNQVNRVDETIQCRSL